MRHHSFRALAWCMLLVAYTTDLSSATESSRRLLFAENKVLTSLHDAADRPASYPARGLDTAALARGSLRGKASVAAVAVASAKSPQAPGLQQRQQQPSLFQEPRAVGSERFTASRCLQAMLTSNATKQRRM